MDGWILHGRRCVAERLRFHHSPTRSRPPKSAAPGCRLPLWVWVWVLVYTIDQRPALCGSVGSIEVDFENGAGGSGVEPLVSTRRNPEAAAA
jgi:hypothetical protein